MPAAISPTTRPVETEGLCARATSVVIPRSAATLVIPRSAATRNLLTRLSALPVRQIPRRVAPRDDISVSREKKFLQLSIRRTVHQPARRGTADVEQHCRDFHPAALARSGDPDVADRPHGVERFPSRADSFDGEEQTEVFAERGAVDA